MAVIKIKNNVEAKENTFQFISLRNGRSLDEVFDMMKEKTINLG